MTLGDQIVGFALGKEIKHEELRELYSKTPPKLNNQPIIQPLSYRPKSSPISGKYLTYQFDKGFGQRTWCAEHIFSNRQFHALYHLYSKQGFKLIDIGHSRYSLKTTADIISGSLGHFGVCSGMAWFSLACGVMPTIWYNTNSNCGHLSRFKNYWSINKVKIKYFDEEFELIPCNKAVDGKKYNPISR